MASEIENLPPEEQLKLLRSQLETTEARALGNSFLLHYLLQAMQDEGLLTKDGKPLNIAWVLSEARRNLADEGGGRDTREDRKWLDAERHLKHLGDRW